MQVPLDGMVVHGTAQVSWAHISGEALPVQLQQGDQVPAGTLNHDGLLVVQASKGFQDSTPARIARLTAQAQASPFTIWHGLSCCGCDSSRLPNACPQMFVSA